MKLLKFLWEYKYIVMPLFLWISVYLDVAHLYLEFPKQYKGIYYGVEINFSALAELIIKNIKSITGGF
jgi:hypothetical protein